DAEAVLLVFDLLSSGKNLHVASFEPFASSRTLFPADSVKRRTLILLVRLAAGRGRRLGARPRTGPVWVRGLQRSPPASPWGPCGLRTPQPGPHSDYGIHLPEWPSNVRRHPHRSDAG